MSPKVAVLLILTLSVMRCVSWAIGWALGRVSRSDGKLLRVGANLLALAVFAALLVYNRVPGEVIDREALVFGIIVFAVFTAIDCWWWPWRRREPGTP